METIMMAIHPKWCELIFNGKKTIEVRKTAPEPPFKVVVYCTKAIKMNLPLEYDSISKRIAFDIPFGGIELNGKVIGEFIVEKVDRYIFMKKMYFIGCSDLGKTCLDDKQLNEYGKQKDLCGLHITAPALYDRPRELGEFYRLAGYEQDWCVSCPYHELSLDDFPCSECNGDRAYVTHAPQSWFYLADTEGV